MYMLDTLESLDNTAPKVWGTIERIRGLAGIISDDAWKKYLFLSEVCKWGPEAFPTMKEGMRVVFNEVVPFNPWMIRKDDGLACNVVIDIRTEATNLVSRTEMEIQRALDNPDRNKTV